jgi:hypothetical protein
MRYSDRETPIVAAEFTAGVGIVAVQITNLEDDTVIAVTDNQARESLVDPGLYTFSLANVVDPILGFTQAIIKFTAVSTGEIYRNKVVLRGYVDDVRKTKQIVATMI